MNVILTPRLELRRPVMSDVPAIVPLVDNIQVSSMTGRIPYPYTAADAEAFVAWADSGNARVLVRRDHGDLIGCIGVEPGDPPELGYWLGEPYWGHGYTTEAARAMLLETFADAGTDVVVSHCRTANAGSRRVLEKCGFRYVGPGEMTSRALGETTLPARRYRLERAGWLATATMERQVLPVGTNA